MERTGLFCTQAIDQGHKLTYTRAREREELGEKKWVNELLGVAVDNAGRQEVICEYMERNYQHTWELSNTSEQYFRYFRMIGADNENDPRCLHAIDLEI